MVQRLFSSPSFVALFWCQFCSALNDNFLKNALGMLLLVGMTRGQGSDGIANADILITLSGIVFIAPYFILSALGGELADRYDKGRVAERVKFFEIPVAMLAALGFYLYSIPVLFLALAGFGIIGALFGPLKYGLLPERLDVQDLPAGNAFVEAATFLAILIGTIAGGLAVAQTQSPIAVSVIILVLALATWLMARAIPFKGPAAPDLVITRNVWVSTRRLLGEARAQPRLWTGALITSWFWVTGSVALALLPPLTKMQLNAPETMFTVCLAVFTIGIAVGSAIAARSSHGGPNLRVVPFGAFGMGIAALVVAAVTWGASSTSSPTSLADAVASSQGLGLLAALFVLAAAGGIFIVPAFAAVQAWSPPDRRARVIAAVNVLNAAAMVAGGLVLAILQKAGFSAPALFAVLGIACLVVGGLVQRAWATVATSA
jgi:acyl-[acyl-carrier-protein]-phospholipid O-acyltransferase/long-chain-fatty-acid--[acyl-carrier-protein] ligase